MKLKSWIIIILAIFILLVYSASYFSYPARPSGISATFRMLMHVGGVFKDFDSNTTIQTNTWTHVAATYNGSVVSLYVNGVNVRNYPYTGTIGTTTLPLVIGKEGQLSQNYFNGTIDEVKIYNRALSSDEIADMYNYSLVGYWKFDEGSGNTTADASGNGDKGIIHGASWTAGRYGTALSFNGVNNYVSIPDSNVLDPTNAITVAAWIYPKTLNDVIIGKFVSGRGSSGYGIDLDGRNGLGWLNWFDQSVYYKMSDDLAKGGLPSKQDYMYGLGYPILSVPFSFLFPNDRFFIPDAVIFVAIIIITYITSLHFLKDKLLALIPIALLLTLTEFLPFSVMPWCNIVTSFGIAAMTYLALQKLDNKRALAIGLILGWVFSARYIDMLFLLPLAAVPLLEEGIKDFRKVLLILIPALIIVLAVLATHQIVFGNALSTPYDIGGADLYNTSISMQDLRIYDVTKIPARLYALTIDPMSAYRQELAEKGEDKRNQVFNSVMYKTPLINSESFFLIFAPVGIIVSLIIKKRRERRVIIGWVLSFLSSSIFYLSFIQWHAGWTPYWRYFDTWMPTLVIFSTVGMIYIAEFILKRFKHS